MYRFVYRYIDSLFVTIYILTEKHDDYNMNFQSGNHIKFTIASYLGNKVIYQ